MVDNIASWGLRGEHGLSFLVESGGKRILLDCGAGDAFEHNARRLGIAKGSLDALVLSHGHYDHTGGLEYALELLSGDGRVVFHPSALEPKYSGKGGMHCIGIPERCRLRLLSTGLAVNATRLPVELGEGITTSGEIPRMLPEEAGANFFSDPDGQIPDGLPDDLSVYIRTAEGLVILSGCCHAGMGNTIEHAARTTGAQRIHAFIGGTHLCDAGDQRINFSIEMLKSRGLAFIAPCHCTGDKAKAVLRSAFPDIYHDCVAGEEYRFRCA